MSSHIPEELWPEILCRLPVKSLLRFRCVCKSWRLMIDDPDFCHLHLNYFENNSHQTHLLFLEEEVWGLDCVVKCSNTMETTATIGTVAAYCLSRTFSSFDSFGYPGGWCLVSLIDGLVLLQERNRDGGLLLWNLPIRKFRSIPPSSKYPFEVININLGLGFDPFTKDYKVVRLVTCAEDYSVWSVSVYSTTTGLWREIPNDGKECSGWHWSFRYVGPDGFKTVCFQGYLCLIAQNAGLGVDELVSFDLGSEEFASVSLPKQDDDTFYEELVMYNDECLLLWYDTETTNGLIWVLESSGTGFGSMYWKKRSSFCTGIPELYFASVLKNGDLLLRNNGMVARFIAKTLEVKMLLDQSDTGPYIVHVHDYIESLILLG